MYKASRDRITGRRIKICLQWEIVTQLSLIIDIKTAQNMSVGIMILTIRIKE